MNKFRLEIRRRFLVIGSVMFWNRMGKRRVSGEGNNLFKKKNTFSGCGENWDGSSVIACSSLIRLFSILYS